MCVNLDSGEDMRDGYDRSTADKLRDLRGADHQHGAGSTYPDLVDVLAVLDDLTSRAPRLATMRTAAPSWLVIRCPGSRPDQESMLTRSHTPGWASTSRR